MLTTETRNKVVFYKLARCEMESLSGHLPMAFSQTLSIFIIRNSCSGRPSILARSCLWIRGKYVIIVAAETNTMTLWSVAAWCFAGLVFACSMAMMWALAGLLKPNFVNLFNCPTGLLQNY